MTPVSKRVQASTEDHDRDWVHNRVEAGVTVVLLVSFVAALAVLGHVGV